MEHLSNMVGILALCVGITILVLLFIEITNEQ